MKKFTIIEEKVASKCNENMMEQPIPEFDEGEGNLTQTETDESSEEVSESNPVKFISKLFESREMAHMFHLKAQGDGSHASHLALEGYYEEIINTIDDLVEVYQGQYDIIEGYDIIDKENENSTEPVQYFIDVAEFVKRTRYSAILEEDAHIQAIIDDVLINLYKLVYKLRFLK